MKKQLRNQMLDKMSCLSSCVRNQYVEQVAKRLFNSEIWKNAKTIAITYSIYPELDTIAIIKQAWLEEKIVLLPKTIKKNHKMVFIQVNKSGDLERVGKLVEPSLDKGKSFLPDEIDVMVVPGILFTREGYRIGFGGGYYDRYLANYRGVTVSLLFEFQLVSTMPIEAHDIHVQHLITNERIVHCFG